MMQIRPYLTFKGKCNEAIEQGRVGIPLQETFFSPCHGVVFDKFGVMWNFVAQS